MAPTVGELLRKTREERGLNIDQASRMVNVRVHYLEALENDLPDRLPSRVQGRGFLRLYADALRLPVDPLLKAWEAKAPVELPQEGEASEESSAPEAPSAAEEEVAAPLSLVEMAPVEPGNPFMVDPRQMQDPAPDEEQPAVEPVYLVEKEQPPADLAGQEPSGSRAIFQEIGSILRSQREALGLSLMEVERYTRLRTYYITALEEGRMEGLPSMVQGRGMLSNYAEFLNLDEEKLLLRFAEGLQLRRVERIPKPEPQSLFTNKKRPARQAAAWRRFITPDLIFGIGLSGAILLFAVLMLARVSSDQTAEAQPTMPAIAEILLTTPTPDSGTPAADDGNTAVAGESAKTAVTNEEGLTQATLPAEGSGGEGTGEVEEPEINTPAAPDEEGVALATLLPIATEPNVTPTLPPANSAPVQLYIVARQRAFLQVTVDGKVQFMGRTVPGNAYAYSGNQRIEMVTGNAAALQVFYNQNDLGPMGNTGQVVGLIFEPVGMMTPTPAFTSTPTATPPATITPLPSPTLAATPTITPFVPEN